MPRPNGFVLFSFGCCDSGRARVQIKATLHLYMKLIIPIVTAKMIGIVGIIIDTANMCH